MHQTRKCSTDGCPPKAAPDEKKHENALQEAVGSVWILAEQSQGRLKSISYELLARGRSLADKLADFKERNSLPGERPELCAVVMGCGVNRDDLRELIERGADKAIVLEHGGLKHPLIEPCTKVAEWLVRERKPSVILAGATSLGRTLMPCLAVRLTTGLTADCTGLDIDPETGNLVQTRPAIGGNILATIVTAQHRPQMATVRPRSTRPPERDASRQGVVEEVSPPPELTESRVEWLTFKESEEADSDIQDADKVVAGGRGLKKAEHFGMVRELAAELDAAVGASRESIDRGWLSYPHQVGLSGKTVTPRLYMALGISGAIQHLAGMKTADCVVAVNADPDAQIFQVADFGIVGDLFEFLPAFAEEVRRRKTAKAASS